MAVMISRALALDDPEDAVKYKDSSATPEFARDAVDKVSAAGLFKGSDGLFRPRDGATRAETAAVVNRLLSWWVK